MESIKETGSSNRCPNPKCSRQLDVPEGLQQFDCPFCGTPIEISGNQLVSKVPFEELAEDYKTPSGENNNIDGAPPKSKHYPFAGLIATVFPQITSAEIARKAALQGSIAAIVIVAYALVTLVLARQTENIVDCLLFTIISWRIRRMSIPWALIGLLVFLVEVGFFLTKTPLIATIVLLAFAIPFTNAVRGTVIFTREQKRAMASSSNEVWQTSKGMTTATTIAIFLVSICALGLGMHSRSWVDEPSGDSSSNSKVTSVSSPPEVAQLKVWDRDACLKQNFPQFNDPQLIASVGSTDLGKLRILSAKMYCARQWDASKFAAAASLLQANKLLITQTSPEAAAYESQLGSVYSPFPTDVANFLKVFDSGVLLVHSIEDIEKRQKTDPSIPKLDVIRSVRAKLDINSLWTVRGQLPQLYELSKDPEIKLMTTTGLDMSLLQLWSYSQFEVVSKQRRIISNLTGISIDDETNPTADEMLNFLAFELATARELGVSIRSTTSTSHEDALPSLTILFLPRNMLAELPLSREGVYRRDLQKIFAALPSSQRWKAISESMTERDLHQLASQMVPSALNHEFYHYLFYRQSVASSGFILEGEATAFGEHLTQMGIEGAFADPGNKDDKLEQMTIQLMKANGEAPPDFDWKLYNQLLIARQQKAPLTSNQCRLLTVFHDSYSGNKNRLPLAEQLKMNEQEFQDQGEKEPLAYAQAWAVYNVNTLQHRDWDRFLEGLLPKLQHDGIGSLTAADERELADISKSTSAWVNKEFELKHSECKSK